MGKISVNGKILSLINFMLILCFLTIILITPTANSYEMSIYDSYPPLFWCLILISLFIGSITLIRSYLNEKEFGNWVFGFLAILLTNITLLALPLLRNYYIFGTGDVLTHIGYMKDILSTGSFGDNTYPIIHIWGSELFLATNISLNDITMIFTLILSVFYIISAYFLFKLLFEDKRDVILGLVLSSILLFQSFNTFFSPNVGGFLLIPFFLYCYFNSRKSNKKPTFAIITIITAFLITFLHPLVCLILIFILLIAEISSIIKLKIQPKPVSEKSKIRSPYTLIVMISIILLMWQSYTYMIVKSAKNIFGWLAGQSVKESQLQTYSSVISYANPDILEIFSKLFYSYGQWLVITIISLITIFYLVKNRDKLNYTNIFASLGFLFFIFLSFLALSSVHIFGFGRTYVVAILMATILFPTFLKVLLSKKIKVFKNIYLSYALISLILVPIIFFSTFNLYSSPITKLSNEQVTEGEYVGMHTFFDIRNNNYRIYEWGLFQWRFADAIYGVDNSVVLNNNSKFNRKNIRYRSKVLEHFGYSNYTSMANYYNTSYLLINDLGKNLYPEVYSQYQDKWRFTPDDFVKLNNDNGVNKFFDDGGLNIYLIK